MITDKDKTDGNKKLSFDQDLFNNIQNEKI